MAFRAKLKVMRRWMAEITCEPVSQPFLAPSCQARDISKRKGLAMASSGEAAGIGDRHLPPGNGGQGPDGHLQQYYFLEHPVDICRPINGVQPRYPARTWDNPSDPSGYSRAVLPRNRSNQTVL
jgi:hypothetical protein